MLEFTLMRLKVSLLAVGWSVSISRRSARGHFWPLLAGLSSLFQSCAHVLMRVIW